VLNMKNLNFNTILLLTLIVIIIFLGWKLSYLRDKNNDALDELKKSIIMNDSLTKEADGRYVKLVNYYNTEKDLKEQLKKSNEDLYKIIKKNDEKLLSLTSAVITLQGSMSEGFGKFNPNDTNKIDLKLKYPNDKESFINWDGTVDKKSAFYKGEWSFGKLPLEIVLTEEKRGLWKSRLVGPDWLKVDSMTINSLPASDYSDNDVKTLQFLFGAGYIKALSKTTNNAISVGGGVSIKGKHYLLLQATTNKELGINYYYNFQNFKKK